MKVKMSTAASVALVVVPMVVGFAAVSMAQQAPSTPEVGPTPAEASLVSDDIVQCEKGVPQVDVVFDYRAPDPGVDGSWETSEAEFESFLKLSSFDVAPSEFRSITADPSVGMDQFVHEKDEQVDALFNLAVDSSGGWRIDSYTACQDVIADWRGIRGAPWEGRPWDYSGAKEEAK